MPFEIFFPYQSSYSPPPSDAMLDRIFKKLIEERMKRYNIELEICKTERGYLTLLKIRKVQAAWKEERLHRIKIETIKKEARQKIQDIIFYGIVLLVIWTIIFTS